MIDKYINRALENPSNKWNWYELAKKGYEFGALFELARRNGIINLQPIKEGCREYSN